MDEQQQRTLQIRARVKVHSGIEGILTALAKDNLFADVSSTEAIDCIVKAMVIDDDLRLDMISYLESERAKRPIRT